MPTPTTNYGWLKPDVGGSGDAWGGQINTDLDGIDSTVFSVQGSVATKLALSGGTLTGPVIAAADPTVALGLATKQYVDNKPLNDNRIINGNFAINQRTQVSGTALAAAAYGHDRWKAGASGCTYTFTVALPDTTATITAGTLTQVIEAGMIEGGVYTLSWTGTAQARVYQGAPTGSYAASPVVTASLPAGTNTIVEFNAGTVNLVQFEIGSVVTPFRRYSLAKTLINCQRYYSAGSMVIGGAAGSGVGLVLPIAFPVTMRAVPVTVNSSWTGGSGYTAGSAGNITATGFSANGTGSASSYVAAISWNASAEL